MKTDNNNNNGFDFFDALILYHIIKADQKKEAQAKADPQSQPQKNGCLSAFVVMVIFVFIMLAVAAVF